MINKLVVVINSLNVKKFKKILLYEMKFLLPNYICLQNTWLGATATRSPFSLSSVFNWICWIPPNKIPGYATARRSVRTFLRRKYLIILSSIYNLSFRHRTQHFVFLLIFLNIYILFSLFNSYFTSCFVILSISTWFLLFYLFMTSLSLNT